MQLNRSQHKVFPPLLCCSSISIVIYAIKIANSQNNSTATIAFFIVKLIYDCLTTFCFALLWKKPYLTSKQYILIIGTVNKLVLALILVFDEEDIYFYFCQYYIDFMFYLKFKTRQIPFLIVNNIFALIALLLRVTFSNISSTLSSGIVQVLLIQFMFILPTYLQIRQEQKKVTLTLQQLTEDQINSKGQRHLINRPHQQSLPKLASFSPVHLSQSPHIYFKQIEQDNNRSNQVHLCSNPDINKLMNQIQMTNEEKNQLISQIRLMREEVWKNRMNGMPVGVAMISKNHKKIIYQNSFLRNLMNKILNYQDQDNDQALLTLFTFKIIDLGRKSIKDLQSFQSQNFFNESEKRSIKSSHHIKSSEFCRKCKKNLSFIIDSLHKYPEQIDPLTQLYTISEVLEKLKNNELVAYTDINDHTLELYSTLPNSISQVHLNCRVLNAINQFQENEFTLIIQDYTHQHHLQKIEEQDHFKTKMISSFSHELRTPLNSAMLFIKSAIYDPRLHRDIKENYLQPGLSSLQMQNYLIHDIIDFSQLTAQLFEIRYSKFSIDDIIEELTNLFQFNLKMKKLGLAFNIGENTPDEIKSDKQRLLQILTNIIQNAQKFSTSGYILVEIDSIETGEVTFIIRDEGYGMNYLKLKEVQSIVNQEFQSNKDWKGFGLIISQMLLRLLCPGDKNILELHSEGFKRGFSVQFTIQNFLCSNNDMISSGSIKKMRKQSLPDLRENKGLIITIKSQSKSMLLLWRQKLSEVEVSDQVDSHQSDQNHKILNPKQYKLENLQFINDIDLKLKKSVFANQMTNFQSQETTKCHSKRILSVDDEVFNLASIKLMLGTLGYEVDIAFNGYEAIHKLKEKKDCMYYELILMDCQMPVMDGWEATRELRKLMLKNEMPIIPIVGLTAFTSSSDISECFRSGMTEVLHKPLDIAQFKNCIAKLSKKK